MNDETEDLWPVDLLSKYVKTPKRILTEQANHLNRRGGSFVRAEVQSREQSRQGDASHSFAIICDAISRRVVLFRVEHPTDTVYPCRVNCALWEPPEGFLRQDDDDWRDADGEAQLLELLREILRSAFTRSIIESMQSQAAEYIEERAAVADEDRKP